MDFYHSFFCLAFLCALSFCSIPFFFNFFSTRPLPISHRVHRTAAAATSHRTNDREEEKKKRSNTQHIGFILIEYTTHRHTISPALVCTLFDVDTGPMLRILQALRMLREPIEKQADTLEAHQ